MFFVENIPVYLLFFGGGFLFFCLFVCFFFLVDDVDLFTIVFCVHPLVECEKKSHAGHVHSSKNKIIIAVKKISFLLHSIFLKSCHRQHNNVHTHPLLSSCGEVNVHWA